MYYIKKLIFNLLLILVPIVLFLVSWHHNDGELGKGDYFAYDGAGYGIKKKGKDDLYILRILTLDYNDDFIIAQRLPQRSFHGCKKSVFPDLNITSTIIFGSEIQYIIIDKNTDKIYGTYDYRKFQQKRKEIGLQLDFTLKDINSVQNKIIKDKHLYQNNVTLDFALKNCIESFIDPIIEY